MLDRINLSTLQDRNHRIFMDFSLWMGKEFSMKVPRVNQPVILTFLPSAVWSRSLFGIFEKKQKKFKFSDEAEKQ